VMLKVSMANMRRGTNREGGSARGELSEVCVAQEGWRGSWANAAYTKEGRKGVPESIES
jgi:hypothetical protein